MPGIVFILGIYQSRKETKIPTKAYTIVKGDSEQFSFNYSLLGCDSCIIYYKHTVLFFHIIDGDTACVVFGFVR